MRRLTDEAIPEDELRRAKDHLKGSLMLNLESTSSRMSHLARQELYQDASDGLDSMLAAIEVVSADAVRALAKGLFTAQPLGATVLGDVNGLKVTQEQLAIA
jgi:predicted Zn-dependent peptidase